MKTFVNKLTRERFPEHGCAHWFRLREKRSWKNGQPVAKTTLEIFEQGKGWRPDNLANWVQEEIPDFTGAVPNPNAPHMDARKWKAYAERYGILCAREFLDCCDLMKPTWAFQILNPPQSPPSRVDRVWFEHWFGVDPQLLAVPLLMACLNRYSFDLVAFEWLLRNRFGYPWDKDGISLKSFISEKWGAEVCAYFETHFLKA